MKPWLLYLLGGVVGLSGWYLVLSYLAGEGISDLSILLLQVTDFNILLLQGAFFVFIVSGLPVFALGRIGFNSENRLLFSAMFGAILGLITFELMVWFGYHN